MAWCVLLHSLMDLADLEEGPWVTPVDLRSGDRMTLTVSATPSAEEDGLPDLALRVRHETAQEAEPAGTPRIGLTAAVLLVLGAFGAGWAANGVWEKAPRRQVTSNEPPPGKFSAV